MPDLRKLMNHCQVDGLPLKVMWHWFLGGSAFNRINHLFDSIVRFLPIMIYYSA